MKCVCYNEPRGDNGLEGFELNTEYDYSLNRIVRLGVSTYCVKDISGYTYKLTKTIFNKYFKRV